MPRINHQRITVSRKAAEKISKKADERGVKFGVRLSSVNDSIPARGLFGRKGFISKRGIVKATAEQKRRFEYKMAMQNVVGRMIKEYSIKNPRTRSEINKAAFELATAESAGEKIKAHEIKIKIAQLVASEKGTEGAASFVRMLDWALNASMNLVQRETQRREEEFLDNIRIKH